MVIIKLHRDNSEQPSPHIASTSSTSAIEASASELRESMAAECLAIQKLISSWEKDAHGHGYLPAKNLRLRLCSFIMFENWNSLKKLFQTGRGHMLVA